MALWDWEKPEKVRYAFVVDTTDYAGNFERELATYVVGRSDYEEDRRLEPMKRLYEKECPKDPFEDLIAFRVDDHGDDHMARSPMALAPTPGKKQTYNSVAIFLERKPKDSEIALLVERVRRFPSVCDRGPKAVLACRLVKESIRLESSDAWLA